MIPADVASRLRMVAQDEPASPQPVSPVSKLADVLTNLVPGQRVMAEIQALMPNGTYRAMIAQKEIILALPSSAKAGDALELEVVENDGKLALAFLANRSSEDKSGRAAEAVSANISQAGKLIGNLLGSIDEQGKRPQPSPLNGNQPLVSTFPENPLELAPILKEALTKSGMFYESHQARWLEGKLPTEALLQEPQGKFSSSPHAASPESPDMVMQSQSGGPKLPSGNLPEAGQGWTATGHVSDPLLRATSQPQIPPELAPLVQQQLDALATQTYVWQGQVWPDQQMQWEIEKDGSSREDGSENSVQQWQTRLKLTLPILGGINAVMRLGGNNTLDVSLETDSDGSRLLLASAGDGLRRQLEDAGLNLNGLVVHHGKTPA